MDELDTDPSGDPSCAQTGATPHVLFLRMRNAVTTQKYRNDSRTLLAQARAELAQGDVRQASEKGWGVAALMLKAIAEQRGWEHGKHRHLSRVASRLRAETGDRDIYRWYQVADALHGNSYEDETAPEDIDDSLNDVERLLDKLEPVLG